MKQRPPPWQFPAIVSGIIIALGAIGTFIVRSAKYIEVPEKLEAAEKKNIEQDTKLHDLNYIADQNQKILDRVTQQPAPNQAAPSRPSVWWAQDQDGEWYCTNGQDSWWPNDHGQCE